MSSHLWGYIADTKGRRKVSIFTIIPSIIFTLLTAFVNNFWIMTVLRFCTGFCISGASAAVYAYLGEYNIPKHRATVITWACLFIAMSSIYLVCMLNYLNPDTKILYIFLSFPALGWLILPQTWSFHLYGETNFRPWRLLILIYTIPGILGVLILLFLKESPKYYLSQVNITIKIYKKKKAINFTITFINRDVMMQL